MTFTLTINTDNAAFGETPEEMREETARILRQVADRMSTNEVYSSLRYGDFYETVRDLNGNDVGRAAFKDTPTYSNLMF
jgi:hypothetical protein